MDTAQVPLTNGGFAIVDAADLPLVAGYTWRREGNGYAQAGGRGPLGKQRQVRMHQLIIDSELQIDHRNGNKLDNTRANLRPATPSQNQANRGPTKHSSRFKGVSYRPAQNKWTAQIMFQRKLIYLGFYANEEDAARAYDAKAIELFGEFARTNFPELHAAS